MVSEIHTASGPPGDCSELRREQVQSGPILPLPSEDVPEANSAQSSCPPSSADVQTHEPRRSPGFPVSVILSQQFSSAPGMLSTLWRYMWEERQAQNYRETFVSLVAFASLIMAGVAFWPANTAASDGYKSRLLAEWSARKEFLSNCEAHNWPSPSCDAAKDIQLEAPPNFDRSEWKRYLIRDWSALRPQLADDDIAQLDDVSSNTLAMLLWYPPILSHRNESLRSGTVYIPSNRPHATTSGADVIPSQGLHLRRGQAAQFNGEIQDIRQSDLAEWNIPSVLGESKGTGFVEIHDTQDAVPVPTFDLSPCEVDSDQVSSVKTVGRAYHSIPVKVLDTLRSYTPMHHIPKNPSFLRGGAATLFGDQAQAIIGDLETPSRAQLSPLTEERQYRAQESKYVASLDKQDTHSQHQHQSYTVLVLRPVSDAVPSRPRGASLQWSLHSITAIRFQPLSSDGFESMMPDSFERPLAVYIFYDTGYQLQFNSYLLSPTIEIWSKSELNCFTASG
ncbi:hypothetical protein PG987_013563 [Apiospora arundinis]